MKNSQKELNYYQRLICLLLAALLTIIGSTGIVAGTESSILFFLALAFALIGFLGSNPLRLLMQFETFETKK